MGATLDTTINPLTALVDHTIRASLALSIDGPAIPDGVRPILDIDRHGVTLHLHTTGTADPDAAVAAIHASIPTLTPLTWSERVLEGDWHGIVVRVYLPAEVAA